MKLTFKLTAELTNQNMAIIKFLTVVIFLSAFISSTQSVSCCLKYTKRPVPCKRLMGYTIQTINNLCDISAIIFHVPGKFVCADPSKKWTHRAMQCVDELRRNTKNKIFGSGTSV